MTQNPRSSVPEWSIIVPVYQVEKYLRKCLDSVRSQSFADYECVLIDDGSPDDCGLICDAYAQKDSRFKVIHQPNQGTSAARNAGMRAATGRYLAFLDSDDYISPDYLQNLHEKAAQNTPDALILRHCLVQEDGTVIECAPSLAAWDIDGKPAAHLLTRFLESPFLLATWMVAVKREVVLGQNIFFQQSDHFEDARWVPEILAAAASFGYCDEADYFYVRREGSATAKPTIKSHRARLVIARNLWRDAVDASDPARADFLRYCARESLLCAIVDTWKTDITKDEWASFIEALREFKPLLPAGRPTRKSFFSGERTLLRLVRLFGLKAGVRLYDGLTRLTHSHKK